MPRSSRARSAPVYQRLTVEDGLDLEAGPRSWLDMTLLREALEHGDDPFYRVADTEGGHHDRHRAATDATVTWEAPDKDLWSAKPPTAPPPNRPDARADGARLRRRLPEVVRPTRRAAVARRAPPRQRLALRQLLPPRRPTRPAIHRRLSCSRRSPGCTPGSAGAPRSPPPPSPRGDRCSFADDWFAERDRGSSASSNSNAIDTDHLTTTTGRHLEPHRPRRRGPPAPLRARPRLHSARRMAHRRRQWGLHPVDARRAVMHSTPVHTEAAGRLTRIAAHSAMPPDSLDDIRPTAPRPPPRSTTTSPTTAGGPPRTPSPPPG